MLGRVFQKTINGQQVMGPILTNFIDVQTLTAVTPLYSYYSSTTKRLYVLSTASASPTVLLFNFDPTMNLLGSNPWTYVGKVILTLANAAATTHSFRGFKVHDINPANIMILISSTGSVAINGGTFVGYKIVLADFVPGGTTLWAATQTNQKAVYFLQDYNGLGVNVIAMDELLDELAGE